MHRGSYLEMLRRKVSRTATSRCRITAERFADHIGEMDWVLCCAIAVLRRLVHWLRWLTGHPVCHAAWPNPVQRVAGVKLPHAGETACRAQAPEREDPVNSLAVQRVASSASAAWAQFIDRVQIQILSLATAGVVAGAVSRKDRPDKSCLIGCKSLQCWFSARPAHLQVRRGGEHTG
jgi:hypothetical protein